MEILKSCQSCGGRYSISAQGANEVLMKDAIHFSGLNGLRAIAALAVVFSHTTQSLGEFGLDAFYLGKRRDGFPVATSLGEFGVTIFFVLSGFLITYLLLAEQKQNGTIDIKKFYLRRIFRIWPLYYLFLALGLATIAIYDLPCDLSQIGFYVFLMANIPFIIGHPQPLIGHYWSLGVEEEFYVIWPWVVGKAKNLLRTTVSLAIFLFLLKCVFKFYDAVHFDGIPQWPYQAIHITRFHCMMVGAIGAILYFQKNGLFLKLTNNVPVQLAAWLAIFLAAINRFHFASFLDHELMALVTVPLLVGQIEKTHRLINLELAPLDFIGKVSYGVYVLHPLAIFFWSKMLALSDQSKFTSYIMVYALVFATTIGTATLSYHFFEKRFLRIKERWMVVRTRV